MIDNSENIILQHITGKSSLKDVAVEDLQSITDEYPYFGAAHFLLAKKLAAANNDDFIKAAQKTALHFSNALWLNFNLFNEEFNLNGIENKETILINNASSFDNKTQTLISENELNEETTNEQSIVLNEKIAGILKEQLAAFEKPVEETAFNIEPEPSFKTDYFASQGIKLEIDQPSKDDTLSVRLHKFTDWLKHMKRVNTQLTDLGTDKATENIVQNIAETSNETKEVITETMAEVLIKQGKIENAIELYNKLSFLNPGKSAYFAGRISYLKNL